MAIIDEIKNKYKSGSMLMRIIYINIAVFIVLHIVTFLGVLFSYNGQEAIQWIEVPSSLTMLLHRPWTVITYMFAHYDFLHILFNLLWLYWLGRIFLDYFTPKQLCGLYFLGGIGGAALYVIAYNTIPHFIGQEAFMLGASASILAIVVAIAVYVPNYKINLLFIGAISLKWIAIITILIDFLSIDMSNAGGHIAHIGGALVGLAFAMSIRRGTDITAWLNKIIDGIVKMFKHRQPQVGQPTGGRAYHYAETHKAKKKTNPNGEPTEEELDIILDKIKRSGYSALSDKEKEQLFKASRKR
jgi:membrane associated rhomboid family serine protease